MIVHPAYLRFIENTHEHTQIFANLPPADVPLHRPRLESINDIAVYLGVAPEMIRYIRRYKSKHYRSFEFTKRSGGKRQIDAPRTFLKVVQWWILDTILAHSDVADHIFGFVRGRSFIDNARAHVGASHILNVDIKDFFPSVREPKVAEAFKSLGYEAQIAAHLADLTTLNGTLPQGAPTSPALANLCFERCDLALLQIAAEFGLKYTRYADDLTFSSRTRIPPETVGMISDALRVQGFVLNPKKTAFMGPNDRREVTGLVVGAEGVALPRETLNKARGWFHTAEMSPNEHLAHIERIRGTLELIRQVGGRGSEPLVQQGERALAKLTAAALLT
ncbi:reverse transcriptase family protein [Brevundimonas sp.]|uniref:reverse transcriptase family protein n=1 Tax=Brevundimonas sp. TaxID=1871086 RepID=UPI00391CC3C0